MPNKTTSKRGKRRELDFEDVTTELEKNHNKINFKFKKRNFKFTPKQKELIEILNNPDNKVVLIEGPAGVSKTICAVYCGLMALQNEEYEKMFYIRSIIESGHKSLGYLPGLLEDKLALWRLPLDDKVMELVEEKDLFNLNTSNKIEVLPINYIRGASWRDSYVIFDEFQNTLFSEAKTLLTRIGEGSKLILCGDSGQSDVKDSSFENILEMFSGDDSAENGVVTFRFTEKDIVRSDIVKFIVGKFSEFGG